MSEVVELSGGLEAALDGPQVEVPDDPAVGENHAFWLFAENGEFAVLCHHVETVPGRWKLRRENGSIALGDDRLLVFQGEGMGTTAGEPAAATTRMRCAQPFGRWSGRFEGTARDVSVNEMIASPMRYGPRALVELEYDAVMAVPPWVQGTLVRAEAVPAKVRDFVGGFRYEQLFRADLTLRVDGDARSVRATGLRTHRLGPRAMSQYFGHSWMTAVFPSGRAFGFQRYPDAAGGILHAEGFLYQDGVMRGVTVVDAPWLNRIDTRGEPLSVRLEDAGEEIVITGVAGPSMASTLQMDHAWLRHGVAPDAALVICQSTALFRWGDEKAYGLVERSGTPPQIS